MKARNKNRPVDGGAKGGIPMAPFEKRLEEEILASVRDSKMKAGDVFPVAVFAKNYGFDPTVHNLVILFAERLVSEGLLEKHDDYYFLTGVGESRLRRGQTAGSTAGSAALQQDDK
ncbi:MAG: hypothetical protein ABI789_01145 [Usitatibacter sp.]